MKTVPNPAETMTTHQYTSLIQQYLSMMLYENAVFLAERSVASSTTPSSLYLLALCYYRSGYPKRAKVVLEQSPKDEEDAWRYLLAKCNLDLELYKEAEDALLPHPKDRVVRRNHRRGVEEGDGKVEEEDDDDEFVDWIMSEPCPIPYGAAGLYLLGEICRQSYRKRQAAEYFRLSLRLDPMMWCSYESLCEMGVYIDPCSVFGVNPFPIQQPQNNGMAPEDTNTSNNKPFQSHISAIDMEPSFLPPVPDSPPHLPATNEDTNTSLLSMVEMSYSTPPPSTAQRKPIDPYPRGTTQSRTRPRFHTPDLTPIPPKPASSHRDTATTNPTHHYHRSTRSRNASNSAIAAAAAGYYHPSRSRRAPPPSSPRIVDRAHAVASRCYYEPTPETKATSTPQNHRILFHSLQDEEDVNITQVSSRLSFSSNSTTPQGDPAEDEQRHNLSGCGSDITSFFLSLKESTAAPNDTTVTALKRSTSAPLSGVGAAAGGILGALGTATTNIPRKDGYKRALQVDPKQQQDQEEERHPRDEEKRAIQDILTLLCTLGSAYNLLSQYRCKEALHILYNLLPSHFHTGWVQHQIGKAYFEMADYTNAKHALEHMQYIEPHRIQGLELLSTTLWHLKHEVELCHLAQRVVDFDRFRPESWIVVGNCFSLQKEHETALTFFRRSIQLDPNFTYAHTLSGHEYVSNEDFERASSSFRRAIRIDARHYNAWYGLGSIYYRQEKYDLAEYHFQKALLINPQNSTLTCHLGMAQFSNQKPYKALQTLEQAFVLDPRNPQAKFQRANIYLSLHRPRDALEELLTVRDAAPREASVHFLLGRVYKRLGMVGQAMRCFLTALDLDPKDNNSIKAAMDRLEVCDGDDEEVSAF